MSKAKKDIWPIGQEIKKLQKHYGLNTDYLANYCGVSTRTIQRVIARQSVSLDLLEEILFSLGMELTIKPIGAKRRY